MRSSVMEQPMDKEARTRVCEQGSSVLNLINQKTKQQLIEIVASTLY